MKFSIETFPSKLDNIQKTLGLPIEFFVATEKDCYRKPMTDMWDFILDINQLTTETVDHTSFYCGDAAGRPKDFHITDRYFAHNIGLSFYTPEEIFLNIQKSSQYSDIYQTELNLEQYYPTTPYETFKWYHTPHHEFERHKNIIIMVGPQASGKSTLSKNPLYKDHIYLNSDTIKNITKLHNYFADAIHKGNNVIIDNTNPSMETRKYYIDLAKSNGYEVYCYFFDFPKILSRHLNQMRAQMTHCQVKPIPLIAIHTYYKKLVKPSLAEGFDEILSMTKLHTPIEFPEIFNKYYYYHYDLN